MAENSSLEKFFYPRKLAVAGASNKPGKMGNLFVGRILARFPGKTFLIHPGEREIMGIAAYPNISAIPEDIDLLIPLVPQEQLLALVRNCERGKVKFLLAIPSGFGEVPVIGRPLERELIRLAKEREIRVVGPNSMGMLNCPYALNASMVPEQPPGGPGFSCVTQSGGYGMAIYMYAQDHQLRMAKICDLGNTSDVQIHELLNYFSQDPDTRIVGMFLESVPDLEAFYHHAGALAAMKPVIYTRLGRTAPGIRASFAHIGLGPNASDGEKLNRVIPAQTGLEMLHIAKGLTWQPLPHGKRVGIITGSGGIGAELVDLCLEHGLEVPEFSPALQSSLRPYLPSYASVQNPVDLTPLWWDFPKMYPPLMQTLLHSHEVDLLIVTILDVATTVEELPRALAASFGRTDGTVFSGKPIFVYWASPFTMLKHMRILQEARIPCYQSTLDTVRVASAITHYALQSAPLTSPLPARGTCLNSSSR